MPAPAFEARKSFGAGWSSPVARQAHNLKVAGSNPAPATNAKLSERSEREALRCPALDAGPTFLQHDDLFRPLAEVEQPFSVLGQPLAILRASNSSGS
jgi:hypothetical protein